MLFVRIHVRVRDAELRALTPSLATSAAEDAHLGPGRLERPDTMLLRRAFVKKWYHETMAYLSAVTASGSAAVVTVGPAGSTTTAILVSIFCSPESQ